MENIQAEIQAAIEKNLPKQVGETLRQRLDQADKFEGEIKILEDKNERLREVVAEYNKKDALYQDLAEKEAELAEKEKALDEKERNMEIERLKYELQSEKDRTKFTQEVAMGLVRNTSFRKDVFGNVPVVTRDPSGFERVNNAGSSSNETLTEQ